MAFDEIDEFSGLNLISEDVSKSSDQETRRINDLRRFQKKMTKRGLPMLKLSYDFSAEKLNELAEADIDYALWLRMVMLRLLIKTPVLNTLKNRMCFNLTRTIEFLGFDNFEDFVAIRTLTDIRNELEPILACFESVMGNKSRFPRKLQSNLESLAGIVGLNALEMDLLGLGVLIRTESVLESCCDLLGSNLTGYNIERVLGPMLGQKPEAVAHCLRRSERLANSGLLSIDISGQYSLSQLLDLLTQTFASRMLLDQPDIRNVVEGFVRQVAPSELTRQDYSHVKTNLDVCLSLLKSAYTQHAKGINILIYGKPGTGKTEFARLLAKELNFQMMEISPTNLAGAPVAPIRRVRNYRIAQAFFQQSPSVILFDECEEVIGHDMSYEHDDDETNIPRKSWINKTLENNDVPTIWIANSIRGFEESYIRRFSLCFEMPIPSRSQREKLLSKAFDGVIGQQTQVSIARNNDATPAMLMQTAKVIHAIASDMPGPERDALAVHLMNSTLKAMNKPEIVNQAGPGIQGTDYEPGWINSEVDLSALCDSLQQTRTGRLCLFGPPGTGKTAFGKWLAQKLDVPHMVLKASELLSPYVGESEQNMARAFDTARQQNALLQFDEVDTFLQDRQKAKQQWEITQVNEMLTQMENFNGVFIASTNLFQNLDEASLRRFDMAIKFDYLKPDAAWKMFNKTCETLGVAPTCQPLQSRLANLNQLTPGDFEQVIRRSRLLRPASAEHVLHSLEAAVALKRAAESRPIGFLTTS